MWSFNDDISVVRLGGLKRAFCNRREFVPMVIGVIPLNTNEDFVALRYDFDVPT